MIKIEDYLKKSKQERQSHLRLSEPCVIRGGKFISATCRGILAYVLDTTIPAGFKINLCHACNNEKCSNPYHLYWGTAKENVEDAIACGKKTFWESIVAKYGYEKACKMNSRSESNRRRKKKRGSRPIKVESVGLDPT